MIRIEFKISKINIRFKRKISNARASTSCTRAESILFDSYIELPTQPCEVPKFPKIHSLQNYFPRFRRVGDLFVTGRGRNARRKCERERTRGNNHPAGFPA